MTTYQKMCKQLLLPIGGKLLGLNIHPKLQDYNRFQWLSRNEIDEFQNKRFKGLILFISQKVPFYKKYFRKNGLNPSDFKTIQDISLLPIITKSTIRNHFRDLCVEGYNKKTIEMKSSGSTGFQTTVLVDNKVLTEVLSTQLLFWSWGGFQLGDRHLQTGMSLNRGIIKRFKDYLFQCYYFSAFGLKDSDLLKCIETIQQKNIHFIFGYASSLYVIAKYLESRNQQLQVKKLFTRGDCLFPNYRLLIEKTFNAQVIDCYGLGEGLQVACQCSSHDYLHIAEHHLFVEITNKETAKNTSNEKIGNVIVTRFEPGPMPLIRYETGDISSLHDGKCKCGRNLKLLSRVLGRDTDIIRSPMGDRLIVHFFTQLFEMIPEISQFQIIQSSLSQLIINYVQGDGFHEGILKKIELQINEKCLFKFEIKFNEVIEIPLEKSNKRRFVISKL